MCTSREETAEKAKVVGGFEFATTDPMDIIGRDDIDIVHICTPNSYHKNELLACIAAGKHIYCDKPLCATAAQAQQVLDALPGHTRTHQMTLQYRFVPATMRARQLIDEGFLGPLTGFRAAYLHSGSVDPKRPMGWKQRASMGGGVLNDLATHVVDLVQHLIGGFDEVFCATSILYPERPSAADPSRMERVDAEDSAILVLRRGDGLKGTIEASKIATGIQDEMRFEIHGQHGTIAFNLMEPNWLTVYDARDPGEPIGGMRGFKKIECVQRYPNPGGFPGPKFTLGWIRIHMACLHNFLDALARREKAEPGLEVGAQLQFLMDKAHASAAQGGWVALH